MALLRTKPLLLLVCTANITRSPYLAARLQRELEASSLPRRRQPRVESAGVRAIEGAGPHPVMRTLAAQRDLSLDGHRSRPFDESLARRADIVLTMTRQQAEELVELYPGLEGRALPLLLWNRDEDYEGEVDIPDPTGGEPEEYEAFADLADAQAQRLRRALVRRGGL